MFILHHKLMYLTNTVKLPRRYYISRFHFTYAHNYSTKNCLHFTTWPINTMHKLLTEQKGGRSHNITINNSSLGKMEEFQYLGTTLTNQNAIQEDTMSRFKSGNACYHSVQNLFSSSLLSKNLNIKNSNFACCFVWVWNLVAHIEGRTYVEGVWE
jgi:hypothetical protein